MFKTPAVADPMPPKRADVRKGNGNCKGKGKSNCKAKGNGKSKGKRKGKGMAGPWAN